MWLYNVVQIAYEVTFQKFDKIEYLKDSLMETNDSFLVVSIMFDNLWGVSFDEYDDDEDGARACIFEAKQKNLLGYALMRTRHKIRNPGQVTMTEVRNDLVDEDKY